MEGLGLALDFYNIPLSHLSSTTTPLTHLLTPKPPPLDCLGSNLVQMSVCFLSYRLFFGLARWEGLLGHDLGNASLTLTSTTPVAHLLARPPPH